MDSENEEEIPTKPVTRTVKTRKATHNPQLSESIITTSDRKRRGVKIYLDNTKHELAQLQLEPQNHFTLVKMEAALENFRHHVDSYITVTDDIMLSMDGNVGSNPEIDKLSVEVRNFRSIPYNFKAIVHELKSNLNEIKM